MFFIVLFGIKSGPLVWGRFAAFCMRATMALFPPTLSTKRSLRRRRLPAARVALQCFVDDPFFCLRGSEATRKKNLTKLLLFWRAIGLKLAWRKGTLGDNVEWIGAEIQLMRNARNRVIGVSVTVSQEKAEKMQSKTAYFREAPRLINRKELKEYAGLMTLAATVVPPLKPYVQMVWAAASARPAKGESLHALSAARIRLPLEWIDDFCKKQLLRTPRIFPLKDPAYKCVIGFDASPVGGGA